MHAVSSGLTASVMEFFQFRKCRLIQVRDVAFVMSLLFLCNTGCSRREQPLTFAVGGAPNEIDEWESIAEDFHKETGIDITILRQPTDSDQRRQNLVVALASRQKKPDLFLMDVAWVSQFAASGWLEPLDSIVPSALDSSGPFFRSVITQADMRDGRLIALPVYVDGGLLYYRRDLLDAYGYAAPPVTWNELVTMSRKVQKGERKKTGGFYGFVWQGAQYEGLVCNFIEFAGSRGGIEIEDGEVRLAGKLNIAALEFMRDLLHRDRISPPSTYTEMREEEVRSFFQQGNALFERNWPYAWKLHQENTSPVKDKVGIAPLPGPEPGTGVATLGGWHIGISIYSAQKDRARRFLLYSTSPEIQKRMELRLGWNPGRRDVYDDSTVVQAMPHLAAFKTVFDKARSRPQVPYYSQISEVLQRHLNSVLAGAAQPREALMKAQEEAGVIARRYAGSEGAAR